MVAASIFLIAFPFYEEWKGCAMALGIILVGIPVYLVFVHCDVLQYLPKGCHTCTCKYYALQILDVEITSQ